MRDLRPRPAGARVRNILACFARADAETKAQGLEWYAIAHQYCEDIAEWDKLSVPTVARVIAALSPNCGWAQNVRDASALCAWHANGRKGTQPSAVAYKANQIKARRILDGDYSALKGQKVTAFAALLENPSNPEVVCVDGHAFRLARSLWDLGLKAVPEITAKRFRNTAEEYRRAARKLGLLPNQVQAVCWLQFRKELGGLEHLNRVRTAGA